MYMMTNTLSCGDGQLLVKKARESLCGYFLEKDILPLEGGVFEQSRSLFVTINSYPKKELRGCIGFVNSQKKLGSAICEAAIHAGINDTRFSPIKKSETDKIVFEVSVLTIPKLLECEALERGKHIKIGHDGLIIEYGASSGLLLPQVATEWNFTPKDFLQALCQKAGLPRDMHKSESAAVYKFSAQIFEEKTPCGKIVEKKLFV